MELNKIPTRNDENWVNKIVKILTSVMQKSVIQQQHKKIHTNGTL